MAVDNDEQYSDRELHRMVRKLDGFCFGNGREPLEKRIMVEVGKMVRDSAEHLKGNYRQADIGIMEAIREDKQQREKAETARERQHAQNVSLFKWVIGLLLTGAGLGLTAIGLLIAVLKK